MIGIVKIYIRKMRIAKKIDFEKVKNIDLFIMLKQKIKKIKKTKPNSSISKIGEIDLLNYYLIIECKNVSKELGFENNKKINEISLEFRESELVKNKNLIKHLKNKNSQPFYFKKLGLLNEITGCYLIATTKKEKENISIYNSINTVSCKFDLNNLPSYFEDMCNEYEKYDNSNNVLVNPFLIDMFDISTLQRDNILESILKNFSFIEIPTGKYYTYDSNLNHTTVEHSKNNIEDVIENNIKAINDLVFLNKAMEISIESDNFELCAKIRDRIIEIKNK